ncbi:hypothetical protein BC938DRAFT_481709 [Jimgerdemannia flammicorona]|uniref:2,5-diamino-6-ribosylamino-4(3H)-pyrimidinone 5'-phosphate reductase n=1 Tax=Jimgerdemannia flammicorona TaxID=994334 RepID=A0A433QFP5_9FUNG|nr:hypothetical protein BC938DRAFT_481709 [Jimgerdemannia flammicorona]
MTIYQQAAHFLSPLFPDIPTNEARPFVTLTYAQSIDGKIAGSNGQQLILSGNGSMIMTHRLRTMHDGIMVGIGTILNDDPRLSVRLVDPSDPTPPRQPQPIILDTHLRFPLGAKLLHNFQSGAGKAPWIVTAAIDGEDAEKRARQVRSRFVADRDLVAKIIGRSRRKDNPRPPHRIRYVRFETSCIATPTFSSPLLRPGHTSLPDLLSLLRRHHGIATLMIEGGARVIQACLGAVGHVDLLVVTVAPTIVGRDGVAATGEMAGEVGFTTPATAAPRFPRLDDVRYEQFGRDIVMAARPAWD